MSARINETVKAKGRKREKERERKGESDKKRQWETRSPPKVTARRAAEKTKRAEERESPSKRQKRWCEWHSIQFPKKLFSVWRYSRRKDAREVRYVVEMVAVGRWKMDKRDDRRKRKRETKREKEGSRRNRDRNREKSGGWMEARSRGVESEGLEEEEERRDTPRVKDGASDGKTAIGSESEDNYNDRELHKKGKEVLSCECGGGK